MTDRYFIEDQELVAEFLTKLKPLDEFIGYNCALFIDNETGQHWDRYWFEINYGIDAIGLRKFPYPDTDKIIEIALMSQYDDEVHGAAALLCSLELNDKKEFRQKLLDKIEDQITNVSFRRFDIIYSRAEFFNTINKREIVGKHYRTIEQDAAFYVQMRQKADEIMERIRLMHKS